MKNDENINIFYLLKLQNDTDKRYNIIHITRIDILIATVLRSLT